MSFSLSYDEFQSVNLDLRAARIFPPEVLKGLKFQFPRVSPWYPLRPADFLALAYYGPNVIPATYNGFKGILDKAFKDAVARGEVEQLPRNEMYRQAAEEYGFSSLEAFQALYRELDQTAADLCTPPYAKICNCGAYIEAQLRSKSCNISLPKDLRHTYVTTFSRYVPYLWDIFVATRQGLLPSIYLDHFKGELVYLHKTDDCVEAYIIGCSGYMRGVEQVLNPQMGQSTTEDLNEIREISRKQFGEIRVLFKDMVLVEVSA
ncbi:hypothetical protein AO069_06525 [Pseudomonas syringae pv. syringae PD2774]|uniref:hypothetical protein n=1 Tax=Pseudomonas syringae TaxID=317 RepID=UPI000735E616|nr:hypothetical protein [Pseudomonas syringae]KTB88292.1 hypothetical protein AO069_06525 [Pseudomonas syringae pv. syringae PD2774]